MTEEIINGVDVSGCKYFKIEANTIYPKAHYCGSTFNRFCEDDENCVYKQMKRLEQENAKLKEELAEANQLKDMYHTYYRAKHDDIKGIIFKQKEKLEKIKEIAKENNICEGFGCIPMYKILLVIEGAEDE